MFEMNNLIKNKIIRSIRDSFFVRAKKGKTFIYGYVFDKVNKNNNTFFNINCQNLISLQPSIYDNTLNNVSVYGCEYFFLGKVDCVIKVNIKNSLQKDLYLPIPNKMIYKILNKKFQNTYKCMKNKYSNTKNYTFKFFQLAEI